MKKDCVYMVTKLGCYLVVQRHCEVWTTKKRHGTKMYKTLALEMARKHDAKVIS